MEEAEGGVVGGELVLAVGGVKVVSLYVIRCMYFK